jgi:hypothetical protein
MAALAQHKMSETAQDRARDLTQTSAKTLAPRLATDADVAQPTAVHAQRLLLEGAFAEPQEKPFPPAVKLALLIGVPMLLWASAAVGAVNAIRMIHH